MHSKHSSEDAVRFFVARRPKKISQHLLTGVLNAFQFLHPRFKFARSYEVSHFYPPENGGLAKTSYLEYFDVFRVGFGALAMIRYYYSGTRARDVYKSGKNGNPTKVGTPIGAWNASPKVAAAYIYV